MKRTLNLSQNSITLEIAVRQKTVKEKVGYILTLLFILVALCGNATTYYVSSSTGNDDFTGTSTDQAWQTLDKVNATTFQPGDNILFKCGDSWSGTIIITNSGTEGNPITFGSYDDGEKPVINGTTDITGWTNHSGNIYKATVTERFNQLYVDGVKMTLTKNVDVSVNEKNVVTSVINESTFISTELIGTDWTGAYFMGKLAAWSYESLKVIACNSSTGEITLEKEPSYDIGVNSLFFMTNSLSNLDEAGEWCLDEATNTVYLWTPDDSTPTNVEASTIQNGIVINNVDIITVTNLKFEAFDNTGIIVNDESNYKNTEIIVNNCEFQDCYKSGINFSQYTGNFYYPTINSAITNNIIKGSSCNGISAKIKTSNISNNTIQDIGLLEDIGLDGYVYATNGATAINIYADNSRIEFNNISNVGYNGITFKKAQVEAHDTISYNIIERGCLHLNDGGAIYTYGVNTGSVINGNIISNMGGVGLPECHGIYMDASTDGVTVSNNTIYNCLNTTSFGIFQSHSANVTVKSNTVYNNSRQYFVRYWSEIESQLTFEDNKLLSNTFYSLSNDQITAAFALSDTNWSTVKFDSISGNGYYNPQSLTVVNEYTYKTWQDYSGETNTKGFESLISNYSNLDTVSTVVEHAFDSDVSGFWGSAVWNATQFDGGCMKVSIPSNGVTGTWDNLSGTTTDVTYITFDVVTDGSDNAGEVYFAGEVIGAFIADATERHFDFFVETDDSFSKVMMNVNGEEGDNIYFDNVNIHEVTAEKLEPTEKSKLFVNETKSTKSFNLSGIYTTLDGENISGNISLQPFTSQILIKSSSSDSFTNSKPTINNQNFSIIEEKQSGDFIGQVSATDPDTDQTLSFEIIQGNAYNLFSIDATNGQITSNQVLSHDHNSINEMVVAVTDNASSPLSASAAITIDIDITAPAPTPSPDVTAPGISTFTLPETSTSLNVPILSFTASDDKGVTAYMLTESASAPSATDEGWETSVPENYSFSEEGTVTLYAWVIDDAGNVSDFKSASVQIALQELISDFSEYLFEGDSGSTVIDNQNNINGTIVNEVTRTDGFSGSGMQFSRSGYINLGQCFGENVSEGLTLSAWINLGTDGHGVVLMHGAPSLCTFGLSIDVSTHSVIFETHGPNSINQKIENISSLWDGNWHQLTATYNGAEKIIYLDGSPVSTIEASGSIDSGAGYNMYIGAGEYKGSIAPAYLFRGFMDEVRIYNYALSASEIQSIYSSVTGTSQTVYTTEEIAICEGSSYKGWTSTGQYQQTLTAVSGADSIVTTNLTVNPVVYTEEDITIGEGESYEGWSESGTYQRTLTAVSGCDSIVTTNLTVLSAITTTEDIIICEGSSYEGWTSSGQYQRTLSGTSGTDSIVITNLTVNPVYEITEDISIAEGENYEGWSTSGTYERNLTSVSGCDSIVTTNLTVLTTVTITEEVSICEGENYKGWTKSGEYQQTLKSTEQGDSIVITYLTVNPVYQISENITITEGDEYLGWTISGVYQRALTSIFGCDSTVTTNLTVEPVSSSSTSHFETNWDGQNGFSHMNINILSATLNDTPLEAGDEIAVFDGELCVGAAVLSAPIDTEDNTSVIQISVSLDDGSGNGFTEGNSILFKIWDSGEQSEKIVTEVVFHDDLESWEISGTFVADETSVVDLIIEEITSQTINLEKGWNIISSSLIPELPSMDIVQQTLVDGGQLVKVQDELGNTFEKWNTVVGWVNNIGDVQQTEGYKIRVKSDCTLEITGTVVSLPMNISLTAGWNIISFPSGTEVNALEVVQPLIDQGILVKVLNENGNSIEYWDSLDEYVNNIGNFKAGEGYMVQVSTDGVLPISDSYTKSASSLTDELETVYFAPDFEGNGTNHMNINLVKIEESGLQAGDEIAAFDGDICVGTIKITNSHIDKNLVSLSTSLADVNMENGFTEGNTIELVAWSRESGNETEIQPTILEGSMIYEKRSSVFIQINNSLSEIEGQDNFEIDMFPNPASDKVTIQFSDLPEMGSRIVLMDISGKQIHSREVESTHEVIDLNSYPTGIYLVKTVVGNEFKVEKLIKN